MLSEGGSDWGSRTVQTGLRERSGVVKGTAGQQITPRKHSNARCSGIGVKPGAIDRIVAMRPKLDAAGARLSAEFKRAL